MDFLACLVTVYIGFFIFWGLFYCMFVSHRLVMEKRRELSYIVFRNLSCSKPRNKKKGTIKGDLIGKKKGHVTGKRVDCLGCKCVCGDLDSGNLTTLM